MKSVKDYNSYVKLIRAVVMVVVCFTVIYVVTLAGKSRINNYKSSEKSRYRALRLGSIWSCSSTIAHSPSMDFRISVLPGTI